MVVVVAKAVEVWRVRARQGRVPGVRRAPSVPVESGNAEKKVAVDP